MVIISVVGCKSSKKKRQSYLQSAYIELKDSLPEADVTILRDSIKVIFPDNIMFNINESEIIEPFVAKIFRFSQILTKYSKTNILITGHTDDSGTEEFNTKLSGDRAMRVKEKLASLKVQPDRIFTWGIGSKSPILPNTTIEGRAKNRRVEFIILYNSKENDD